MHGHPYPSVFARDTGAGPSTAGIPLQESHLEPVPRQTLEPGTATGGNAVSPLHHGTPETPHKPINHSSVPVHFYRLEFRRLDGEELSSHWKEWYPWMLKPETPVSDEQRDQAPSRSNGPIP
jgi:hypothetical protein